MRISFNRILGSIAFSILILIIAGTLAAFILKKADPGKGLRKKDPVPAERTAQDSFSELGELRIPIKNGKQKENSTLVLLPWLSYDPGDKAFHEELSQKKLKIRMIFITYFSDYTETELLNFGEQKIKQDLLHLINSELVLGKITAVYFSEYIFLE
ncbi:MAG: flagellar basal body-associated FliL family protein [Treponema sp.]|jgi:flagellar basal body-associated protein FliL|nr:flagellar basal body-associated FliL family protein [Treponema sp.]